MHFSQNKSVTRGITYIEFLIVFFISSLLLTIILKTFANAWQVFHLQSSFVKLQNNILKSQRLLREEVAKAGQIGCVNLRNLPLITSQNHSLTMKNKLSGGDNYFIVRYADFPHSIFIKKNSDHDGLLVSNNIHYNIGDLLVISNCVSAELIKIKKIHSYHGQLCLHPLLPLKNHYEMYSEVSRLKINFFYIDQDQKKPGLYLKDINQQRYLLLEDVSAMSVRYYMKSNHQIQLVHWRQVLDWSTVVAIKIDLIFRVNQIKNRTTIVAPLTAVRVK